MVKTKMTAGRKRRNSDDVRADILSHATALFAEHGYAAVTVRDISKASNVPMSGIYRYFKDKEHLHDECELTAFKQAGEVIYEGVNKDLETEELVFSITRNLCSVHSNNDNVSILLLRLMEEGNTAILQRISDSVISPPAGLLLEKLEKLSSKRTPTQNLYSIYAMSFGFARLGFLRETLDWQLEELQTPDHAAVFILGILFPRKNWSRFLK